LYSDPFNVEELSQRVMQTFEPATRSRMIAKGLQHCRQFTWDRCAEKTAQAMRRFLGLGCAEELVAGASPECVESATEVIRSS
jgi:hypothetical protein